MAQNHADLLTEIEDFASETGISEITLGRKAMNDPHFVRDLRNGRRLWPETEAKVRDFMAAYCAEASAPQRAA